MMSKLANVNGDRPPPAETALAFQHSCGLFTHRVSLFGGQKKALHKHFLSSRPTRRCRFSPLVTASDASASDVKAEPSRVKVLQSGIDAAVEDFVRSGMNICVGGGKSEDVVKLLDSIAARTEMGNLIDVAFVSASPFTSALLEERELPSDLGVNFKRNIDVFIAPVSAMDSNCNVVLDSDNIIGDKYAASIAEQNVFVVLEGDLELSHSGIQSIPVKVVDFQEEYATESLCVGSLIEFGVRGATLRADGSHIADVSLSKNAFLPALEEEFQTRSEVLATGLLLASKSTTAVIATKDLEPFDMTSTLNSIESLSEESRTTALKGDKRVHLLEMYAKDWRVVDRELDEVLWKEFSFTTYKRAEAFVRYAQHICRQAQHFSEITHAGTEVAVIVTTKGAKGVSELDAIFAKEISSAYARITAS